MTTVTLIRGDGVGPELAAAAVTVIEASAVDITWEEAVAGQEALEKEGTPLPPRVLDSIRKNRVALKGPITTPIGSGFRSVNVALRRELNLYANLRPARSMAGIKTPFKEIDLVVVRENTEDLYAGIEHRVGPDAAESIKIITRQASEKIVRFAFDYARKHNRSKVTAVHKANILKLSDGLFLEVARQVAGDYPEIEFEDRIVDNMSMQLVQKPQNYDVLVMPNLYGDILSDICAGLVGLGSPGPISGGAGLFEPVHGSAPKCGEKPGQSTAMILSAALMLDHLGEGEAAPGAEGDRAVIRRKGLPMIGGPPVRGDGGGHRRPPQATLNSAHPGGRGGGHPPLFS